jgi:homoserine kinase
VALAAAAFNIGHTALLVAALVTGDRDAFGAAVADRLHQDVRLEHAPASRAALDAAIANGALGAWLSGSGPAIAALCEPGDAARIAAALPPDGRARVVPIDHSGATIHP